MVLYKSILGTIGKTPTVKLNRIPKDLKACIYVKVEAFNPGGSIKDRAALNMIEAAENDGIINSETTIIEPTSGNTGIGLAMVCAVKGYSLIVVMPKSASMERRKILRAYGAKIVLIKDQGMKYAIAKAKLLALKIENSFIPQQFMNPANPEAHRNTTAIEIWEDLDHKVDVFVSAVGTGGTITGTGETLRKLNKNIRIIAIEPTTSPVLSKGPKAAGKSAIQGMGAGFIPNILNTSVYDEIISVSPLMAYNYANRLAKEEGIFAGMSSGAALAAAIEYAEKTNREENIIVILPDTGERYLSTDLWK
ncbi:MAG: cysteine synthase A [Candidatus Lokiarchaeota archaeon]|nr:cysteine synthase A [Candidatus Lokiarchaeota archaeon]